MIPVLLLKILVDRLLIQAIAYLQRKFSRVESITKDDIVNWANYRLKGKPIALAAVGNVKTLPSHKEISEGMFF